MNEFNLETPLVEKTEKIPEFVPLSEMEKSWEKHCTNSNCNEAPTQKAVLPKIEMFCCDNSECKEMASSKALDRYKTLVLSDDAPEFLSETDKFFDNLNKVG